MSNLRANCPCCGNVSVASETFTLTERVDSLEFFYAFRCPNEKHNAIVFKKCSQRISELIFNEGVPIIKLDLDAVYEQEGFPEGLPAQPITHDEVIDFSQAWHPYHNHTDNNYGSEQIIELAKTS